MTREQMNEKINYIENNPAASKWLKDAWDTVKFRDPVDALEDVELLADIVMTRWCVIKGFAEKSND